MGSSLTAWPRESASNTERERSLSPAMIEIPPFSLQVWLSLCFFFFFLWLSGAKTRNKYELSSLCVLWQLPFQVSKCSNQPNKAGAAWRCVPAMTGAQLPVSEGCGKAKVAAQSPLFIKHKKKKVNGHQSNTTLQLKQWGLNEGGFDELFFFPLRWGCYKRWTLWTIAMGAHLFFFLLFFVSLWQSVWFFCLFPALLFAVSASRLMATLKAKTIAFILSAAQTKLPATTLKKGC